MLSLHTDAAPIHSLPEELLMKIFGMTWSLEGRLSPDLGVPSMAHVVSVHTRVLG